MTDRILYGHFVQNGAVVQFNEQSIANAPLLGIMVVNRELLLLDAVDLRPELVNTRVGGGRVRVVFGGQAAVDQREGNHVLDGMAVITDVSERST